MGLMTADEYQRAADIESLEVQRLPAGRNIPHNELAAMLAVWDKPEDPKAVRNAALLAVLYSTAMRRAEAAAVLLERYDAGERSLKIIGKRDKERYVYVSPSVVPVLNVWLSLLGARRGPMFRPIHKTGKILDGPMTPRAIGYIVDRTCKAAGVPPTTTHDFRRTHTGDLLDAGVDLATAQKLLGHASATTTAAYDRRPERAARSAADKLLLPSLKSLRDAEPLPQDRSET
jgi:integrase